MVAKDSREVVFRLKFISHIIFTLVPSTWIWVLLLVVWWIGIEFCSNHDATSMRHMNQLCAAGQKFRTSPKCFKFAIMYSKALLVSLNLKTSIQAIYDFYARTTSRILAIREIILIKQKIKYLDPNLHLVGRFANILLVKQNLKMIASLGTLICRLVLVGR